MLRSAHVPDFKRSARAVSASWYSTGPSPQMTPKAVSDTSDLWVNRFATMNVGDVNFDNRNARCLQRVKQDRRECISRRIDNDSGGMLAGVVDSFNQLTFVIALP